MCGLTGFSGKNNYNLDKIKYIMLLNAIERGRDATGIFTPNSGIMKTIDNANVGFGSKTFLNLKPDNTLIGHVRAKTVGLNLVKNAHPFEFGNVVLAHNGTLEKYSNLATKYGMKHHEWDVDSQILAFAASKNLESEDKKMSILEEYEGAAALLFYDKSTGVLYAWHDTERPLFYGYDTNGDMYISSIKAALDAVEIYGTSEFKPNVLHSIVEGTIIKEEEFTTRRIVMDREEEERAKERKNNRKSGGRSNPKHGKKGFTITDVNVDDLIGCWFRSKVTTYNGRSAFGRLASVRKGEWYFCDGYRENSQLLIIWDEEGKRGDVWLGNVDIENFIPNKNEFVMFQQNIVTVKGNKKLWREGDVARVTKIDFSDDAVWVWHEKNKTSYHMSMGHIRPYSEMDDYLEQVATQRQLEIDTLPENPTCDTETPFVEEPPLVDSETEIIEDEAPEDNFDVVPLDVYIDTIDGIIEKLEDLEDKYSRGVSIQQDIDEIKATASLSVDKTYMGTIKK